MQSLQGLGLPSIISMEDFDAQVAWPGAQPSPFGGGGAFAAQELASKEPTIVEGEPLSSLLILIQVYTWLRRRMLL